MTPEAAAIRIQREGVTKALVEDFIAQVANSVTTTHDDEVAREILRGLEMGWAEEGDDDD